MRYLEQNLPSFDEINKGSLGFLTGQEKESEINPGIASVGTNLSLTTRTIYHWAADIPLEIFFEYVLPYGNVNEGRNNWRSLMFETIQSLFETTGIDPDSMTMSEVVDFINQKIWSIFGKEIVFRSSQTPLIYDPMSVIAYGYASCTGVSIFFIDALRSIGIPARLSGTPAWNTIPENGNHNWVEIWSSENGWQFIEALPAGGSGETLSNPCDKWFCNPTQFNNGTEVFSVRFDQKSSVRYPMAWDLTNKEIPGEDRTKYYQDVCMAC